MIEMRELSLWSMAHRHLLGFAGARAMSLAVEVVHGRRRCNDIDEEEADVVGGMNLLEVSEQARRIVTQYLPLKIVNTYENIITEVNKTELRIRNRIGIQGFNLG